MSDFYQCFQYAAISAQSKVMYMFRSNIPPWLVLFDAPRPNDETTFFELRASYQHLIARNVADGFILFSFADTFDAACSIDDVSRGSLSGYKNH
jgi:hypothetical protein